MYFMFGTIFIQKYQLSTVSLGYFFEILSASRIFCYSADYFTMSWELLSKPIKIVHSLNHSDFIKRNFSHKPHNIVFIFSCCEANTHPVILFESLNKISKLLPIPLM